MARAVAELLGEYEVLSNALNTEGCAAAELGREWTGLLNRALELAIRHGLEEQAGRAYSNLDTLYCHQRRFAEAEQYFTEGLAYCEDHDITTFANCLRGGWASALEQTGRWDEAVALSRELLRHGPSPINRISPLLCLGIVAARRGEDGVWELLDEAMTAASGTGEPVWITAARVARAEAHWLAGNMEAARREAELADDKSAGCDAWERGAIALWLRRTGSDRPPRAPLAEPYQIQLDGRPEQAARIWTELGCPLEAALAFHDAAAEAALRQALSILVTLRAPAVARVVRQRICYVRLAAHTAACKRSARNRTCSPSVNATSPTVWLTARDASSAYSASACWGNGGTPFPAGPVG
jgi:tetratricopeptide (TPR) repeat protein